MPGFDWFVCIKFDSSERDAVMFFSVAQQKIYDDVFDQRWIRNLKMEIDFGYNNSSLKNCKIEYRDRINRNEVSYLFYARIMIYVQY